MLNKTHGITAVFGGQVGSEGKGAIVGYLAKRFDYAAFACTFMTNAGHTWQDGGEKIVVQQLPVGIVSPTAKHLVVGPSSAITLDQLEKELNLYAGKYNVDSRLRIDPRVVIIDDVHKEIEASVTKRVASTMKGCGAALADKALRHPRVRLARDIPWLEPYMCDTVGLLNDLVRSNYGVLCEGSQGFDLDINHGIEYPNCTSRQCTPMQLLADLGLDARDMVRNVAVIRSYPIRVGNIEEGGQQVGFSGHFGGSELTWAEVQARSGYPTELVERTTVTQRIRRVFEIDTARLTRMCAVTRPTDIALTFADYIDFKLKDIGGKVNGLHNWDGKLGAFITGLWPYITADITMVKTGPDDNAMLTEEYLMGPDWAIDAWQMRK